MNYEVGEKVEVHAFGHWYEGEVVKVARKLVHVRYTTGTGVTRIKKVSPEPTTSKWGDNTYVHEPMVRKVEQEPVTLSSLPAPEVEEDHERACSFAGCRVRFPD